MGDSEAVSAVVKRDILLFKPLAAALDSTRRSLVSRITAFADAEIVPVLNDMLRKRYTGYSLSGTEVKNMVETHGGVPVDFAVHFRLNHHNEPVTLMGEPARKIGEIQAYLEPTMTNLAREYGFSEVMVFGEPVIMD